MPLTSSTAQRSLPARCRAGETEATCSRPLCAPPRRAPHWPSRLHVSQESTHARRTRRAAAREAGPVESHPSLLLALVDGAMLASCSALCYHGAATFRLESYLGAFFPLPVVLAAARWGAGSAVKTLARRRQSSPCALALTPHQVTTCMLLLLLGGPLRAATYFLLHGAPRLQQLRALHT